MSKGRHWKQYGKWKRGRKETLKRFVRRVAMNLLQDGKFPFKEAQ